MTTEPPSIPNSPVKTPTPRMGIGGGFSSSSTSPEMSTSHFRTHNFFVLGNYLLLGLASSCIFLTISLRLIPTLSGFALIFLHVFAILSAVSAASGANSASRSSRWYATHMVSSVLASILLGAVALLIFTRTEEFLVGGLGSYVKVEDGSVILKMVGGICVGLFCLEWLLMALGFALRYYDSVDRERAGAGGMGRSTAKVVPGGGGPGEYELKDWPWPFQV